MPKAPTLDQGDDTAAEPENEETPAKPATAGRAAQSGPPRVPASEVHHDAVRAMSSDNPLVSGAMVIGDRSYPLREMTFENTLLFGDILMEEADKLDEAGLLDTEMWQNFSPTDIRLILDTLRKIWARVPIVMGRLMALALNASKQDDPEYIVKHITNLQFTKLILAFMEVNQVGDLIANFFLIRQQAMDLVASVQEKMAAATIIR